MNKLFTLLALIATTAIFSQAPQGFNYQATVRNSSGDLIKNTNVYFKFNIIQGSQTSLPIFTEIHYVPTDDLGQVNLIIGQGTATTGNFSELDWSLGSYYLGIELNTGAGYVAMGTTLLLSVPYALYANTAGGGISLPNGVNVGDILVWDGSKWAISSGGSSSNAIEITTGDVSQIYGWGATSTGVIGSDGGSSIIAKGIVWSTEPNPTVSLATKTNEGPGASNFTSSITGLAPNTNYYYRAYATNSYGSFYGNTFNFTTSEVNLQERLDYGETPYEIYLSDNALLDDLYGLTYQGGLIFYLNTANGKGMVSATNDQGTATWGCQGTYITGASNASVGFGLTNTTAIINSCDGNIAARICDNLNLNGYDDWYLPSKDELNLLYTNLRQNNLGNFNTSEAFLASSYWSSTDGDQNGHCAWIQTFVDGLQVTCDYGYKSFQGRVRAVRSF